MRRGCVLLDANSFAHKNGNAVHVHAISSHPSNLLQDLPKVKFISDIF